jgi:hypothetical protein
MKDPCAFLALAAVVVLSGCDLQQPQPQAQALPQPKAHYQRFVPIAPPRTMMGGVPWHGFFALDTKTGTLCMTMLRAFQGDGAWANDVPSCSELLKSNPD